MNHETPARRADAAALFDGSTSAGQRILLWMLLCMLAGFAMLMINQAVMGRAAVNLAPTSSARLLVAPVFRQLDGSFGHTCGVTDGDELYCWGRNFAGQLGDGTVEYRSVPVKASELSTSVQQVATGDGFTCVLLTFGAVECWGFNGYGQLGNGSTEDSRHPGIPILLGSGVTKLAAGRDHICAILDDDADNVFCWGENGAGEIGSGDTGVVQSTPLKVLNLPGRAVELAAGVDHTCALMQDDSIWCWGRNNEGQLGNGTTQSSGTPVAVTGVPPGKMALAAGVYHTCAITAIGDTYCWGDNGVGQLGNNSFDSSTTPVLVQDESVHARAISAGNFFTCVRTDAGAAYCWGGNWDGQLGNGDREDRRAPQLVSGLMNGVVTLGAGTDHVCAALMGGGVKCWGVNAHGQLGDGAAVYQRQPAQVTGITTGVQMIAAGAWHNCLLTVDHSVQCWGANWTGQLGDGEAEDRSTPTSVIGLTNTNRIALGNRHGCALETDGDLHCWGANEEGQLGNGVVGGASTTPVLVQGRPAGSVQAIALGDLHSCALSDASSVDCWGANDSGQLGVGDAVKRSATPVSVSGLGNNVLALSAGARHVCALMLNGAVFCWGDNAAGQLGDNSFTQQYTPVAVVGLPVDIAAISVGGEHSCALTSTGAVYCWGSNWGGQLGNDTFQSSGTPVQVVGLSRVATAISAGEHHTCARQEGGALACWGFNVYSQLGDGTFTNRSAPVAVTGLTGDVQQIVAGAGHTCALVTLGNLVCWGIDTAGQIGVGRTLVQDLPVSAVFESPSTPAPTASPTDEPSTATPVKTTTPLPTATPNASPTPDARAVYLPYASNNLDLQWRKWGEGAGVASTLAHYDEQIFVGDRRTFAQGGGLYSGVLGNCNAPIPWASIASVSAGVLSVDFSGDLGLAAAYNDGLFAYSGANNQWTPSGNGLAPAYTVAFAGDVGYAGVGRSVHQRINASAAWSELFEAAGNINVIRRKSTSLWVGTDGAGVQEHLLGTNTITQRNNGLGSAESLQVWDLLLQDDVNHIATYDGVYWSDSLVNWQRMGSNLSGMQIRALEIFEEHLYAGTVGAGVWRIPIAASNGVWQLVTTGEPQSDQWTVRDLLAVDAPCEGLLAATDEGVWLFR